MRLLVTSADGVHGVGSGSSRSNRIIPRGGKPVAIDFTATRGRDVPDRLLGGVRRRPRGHARAAGRRRQPREGFSPHDGTIRCDSCGVFVCCCRWLAARRGCDEKLSDLTGPTPNLTPTLREHPARHLRRDGSSGRLGMHPVPRRRRRGRRHRPEPHRSAAAYAASSAAERGCKPGRALVIPGDPTTAISCASSKAARASPACACRSHCRALPHRGPDAGHSALDAAARPTTRVARWPLTS